MLAGVSRVDITPRYPVDLAGFSGRKQPMTGVLDPLFVRTVAFADDKQRGVIAVADNLGVPHDCLDPIRGEAQARFSVDPETVHVVATHTHSAPCLVRLRGCGEIDAGYRRFFIEKTVESVGAALENLRPARMALSEGTCDLCEDRRAVEYQLDRPEQTDPEVLTLWLYEEEPAKPFAAMVNYACHGVVMSDRLVSADWPGAVCGALGRSMGPGFTAIAMPGAGGNVNPRERGEPRLLDKMGEALARCVLESDRVSVNSEGPIETRSASYILRGRLPTRAELIAERDALMRELVAGKGDIRQPILEWTRDRLAELENGTLRKSLDISLNVLAIGPIRFAFFPFEAFTETALALKRSAPGRVFVAGCADGIFGYLPIESAYAEGGYEVELAYKLYDGLQLQPGTAEEIAAVMRLLL